uniref:Putative c2h2-type zn-finger protein n=1 Tax=Lutzomyia longipalpis TaxID=7200 RepID=A0A1B0CX91_LUTLO
MNAEDPPEAVFIKVDPNFILFNSEDRDGGPGNSGIHPIEESWVKEELPDDPISFNPVGKSPEVEAYRREGFKNFGWKFWCKFCEKGFTQRSFLLRHEIIHTGAKPFRCDICSKTFGRKDQLKRHRQVHGEAWVEDEEPDDGKCKICVENCTNRDHGAIGEDSKPPEEDAGTSGAAEGMDVAQEDENDANSGNEEMKAKEKKFLCTICGVGYARAADVARHELTHTAEPKKPSIPIICEICNKTFSRKDHWKKHMRLHGIFLAKGRHKGFAEHENQCNFCGEVFQDKEQLTYHRTIHAKSFASHSCYVCKAMFETTEELRSHYMTHTDIIQGETSQEPPATTPKETPKKKYSCNHCELSFISRSKLAKHHRKHQNAKKYSCTKCGKSYDDEFKLDRHMRVHSGTTDHVCLVCNRHFPEAKNLKRHMMTHTGEKPYQCEYCTKTFTQSSNWVRHQKVHEDPVTGEMKELKPPKAPKEKKIKPQKQKEEAPTLIPKTEPIDETTYEIETLEENFDEVLQTPVAEAYQGVKEEMFEMQFNEEEDEEEEEELEEMIYDCIYCFKAFMCREKLNEHTVEVHKQARGVYYKEIVPEKKEKIYKCNLCQMSFSKTYAMARHMNLHKEEKKFCCNICGRGFDDAAKLDHHMKIHTDDRNIKCDICGKSYQSVRNLRRHEIEEQEDNKGKADDDKWKEDPCSPERLEDWKGNAN